MKVLGMVGLFMSGMLMMANLTSLVGSNPEFAASWWKVGFAVISAICCGALTQVEKTNEAQ